MVSAAQTPPTGAQPCTHITHHIHRGSQPAMAGSAVGRRAGDQEVRVLRAGPGSAPPRIGTRESRSWLPQSLNIGPSSSDTHTRCWTVALHAHLTHSSSLSVLMHEAPLSGIFTLSFRPKNHILPLPPDRQLYKSVSPPIPYPNSSGKRYEAGRRLRSGPPSPNLHQDPTPSRLLLTNLPKKEMPLPPSHPPFSPLFPSRGPSNLT